MSTAGRTLRVMRRPTLSREDGFAYVMVLAAVAVLAVMAGTASTLVSYEVKHDKEEELIFRGQAYEHAIRDYYLSAPEGTEPVFPSRPEDLLLDPRYLHKRYVRSLYPDPFGVGWKWVKSTDGGLMGVASRSNEAPLKKANFPPECAGFAAAARYSDWVFLFTP